MNKCWIFISFIFFTCSESKEIKDKTIIPIAETIGTGEILNLSDYAKSIEYIPLETNDSILVGDIEELIYENGHIVLYDYQGKMCKIFQTNGCYKTQLGNKGQGPGEYSFVRAVSFIPESKTIFVSTNQGYLMYDLNGILKKTISLINTPKPFMEPTTVAITDSLYLSHLVALNDFRYRALIWGMKDTTRIYDLHANTVKWDYREDSRVYTVSTSKWRYGDQVRCYWPATDTIFTVDSDLEMKKAFVIDLGKFKSPLKWILGGVPGKEVEISKTIGVYFSIQESSRYLFLKLNLNVLAPEGFTCKKRSPRGDMKEVKVTDVYALFDKETGKLTFLNQPIKHKYLGFKNDLDGGPCFWPKYVSSDDKMITSWNASEFLEIYKNLKNPSASLKKVAESLSTEDNPVLMIVTLK